MSSLVMRSPSVINPRAHHFANCDIEHCLLGWELFAVHVMAANPYRRYDMLTKGFTREELEETAAVELPDRTEMSLINANVAAPINAALALNVLSDNSTAIAMATQTNYIPQSI